MSCQHIHNEIDPVLIPKFLLNNGNKMPCIGYSTSLKGEAAGIIIKRVIQAGYRYINCATSHNNEKAIGLALRNIFNTGLVKREQLWIGSKVRYDIHAKIEEACKKSLADLLLENLDLYLLHWPCTDSNKENATSSDPLYNHDHFMYAWRQMERLVENGLVKNIGTSDLTIPKLKLLLKDAKIKPVCNQFVMHPDLQNSELFSFCISKNIQPVASFPLGSLNCRETEKCLFNPEILKDDVFLKIAYRLNATPCQVAIKWAIQRGQIPLSTSSAHYYEHIEAVIKINLTENDMNIISGIDRKKRKSKIELV